MPRVRLYIALSLDGYIADRDGGVAWLDNHVDAAEGDYGYADFYESVGALAMGRTTYDQVLGFGDWPYPGKPTYVFTHDGPDTTHPHAQFVTDAPARFVADASWGEGDLWLVGGGQLVAAFREAGLIDEYVLTVVPVLLGAGVPLFAGEQPEAALRLADVQHWPSGVVQLRYVAR